MKTEVDSVNKPPVFLTKEERQNLALQRREAEAAQQQRRHADRDDDRRRERKRERSEELELASIKEEYLGSKKPKKRVIKPSEKFRFSFDWENSEDTSRDMNPLYQNPHVARPLISRGFRPGTYDTFDMKVDRHWSQKVLDEMSERDWRIFREDFNISYKGSRIPHPIRTWDESNLDSKLLSAVKRAGYKTPSPIQMAAIPIGLQQRDVIGISQTGSGKTAAFVLPMLNYITTLKNNKNNDGPYAVVMAPTRELAQQIEQETVRFAHYLKIKAVCIVGGQSIQEQGFRISQGCDVVIATPGRLLDCLERQFIVLNYCNYVVLDEADRMIDMGFEPQVISVLDSMMKPDLDQIHRTTYMFSATMPPSVERLARNYLRNPVVVTIGTVGNPTDKIKQHVIMTKENDKMDRLKTLLNHLGDNNNNNNKAIVFVNTRMAVDNVAKNLEREGYFVTTLHGGKSQEQRDISLDGFRGKRVNLLVATDVAGRGIDIPDVAHVINYDMPTNIETFTHRIGRTGRAGKTGVATTFLTLGDTDVFFDLYQMLVRTKSHVPPELARHEASKFKSGLSRRNDTH